MRAPSNILFVRRRKENPPSEAQPPPGKVAPGVRVCVMQKRRRFVCESASRRPARGWQSEKTLAASIILIAVYCVTCAPNWIKFRNLCCALALCCMRSHAKWCLSQRGGHIMIWYWNRNSSTIIKIRRSFLASCEGFLSYATGWHINSHNNYFHELIKMLSAWDQFLHVCVIISPFHIVWYHLNTFKTLKIYIMLICNFFNDFHIHVEPHCICFIWIINEHILCVLWYTPKYECEIMWLHNCLKKCEVTIASLTTKTQQKRFSCWFQSLFCGWAGCVLSQNSKLFFAWQRKGAFHSS